MNQPEVFLSSHGVIAQCFNTESVYIVLLGNLPMKIGLLNELIFRGTNYEVREVQTSMSGP